MPSQKLRPVQKSAPGQLRTPSQCVHNLLVTHFCLCGIDIEVHSLGIVNILDYAKFHQIWLKGTV